mmetsp:Transcript_21228/g.51848  ORF Transcript_21228/g.51848 Transcript_21228/m.51848 type:complete len:88 (+) Transcript_21228:89-352(+)
MDEYIDEHQSINGSIIQTNSTRHTFSCVHLIAPSRAKLYLENSAPDRQSKIGHKDKLTKYDRPPLPPSLHHTTLTTARIIPLPWTWS